MNFDNYVCDGQMSFEDLWGDPTKIDKPIRLIELFAGVGSQAMALRNIGANFTHHRVIEFDKYAMASYNAIHGTNFEPTDICTINGTDLGVKDTDKYTYIMTYSFPCQDLSVAGKMRGMEKGSGTRSSLLFEVGRLLDEVEELPQILLMENVPQVVSKKNEKAFGEWKASLEWKGYKNYIQILNAKDYGVAQSRKRCFMVSILGDKGYQFPKPIPLDKCMNDYLEDEVEEKYYINSDKARDLIDKLIIGGKLPGGGVSKALNCPSIPSRSTGQTASWQERTEESVVYQDKETECVRLLDMSMAGHEGGMPRVYTETVPSLQARDYKEPRMILECKRREIRGRKNGEKF